MKKGIISAFFLGVLLVASTGFIFAKENNSSRSEVKRAEVQEKIEERKLTQQEMRTEIQKRVEERKASQEAKVKSIRQERIRNYWEILGRRILASIERLEKLITRIESRLVKIKADNPGEDLSQIKTQIDHAKELIENAKVKYDEVLSDFENLLISDDPKLVFGEIRETVKDIKDDLVEAHRILVHVIGDIKGLRVGSNGVLPTTDISPTLSPIVTPTDALTPTLTPTIILTPTLTPTPGGV